MRQLAGVVAIPILRNLRDTGMPSSETTEGLEMTDFSRHEFLSPTTRVDDTVLRSLERCRLAGRHVDEKCEFNLSDQGSFGASLEQHHGLLEAASHEVEILTKTVGGAGYAVLLTDAQSRALLVSGVTRRHSRELRAAFRPGVDLSEEAIGNNAMTNSIVEQREARIFGAEHYLRANQVLSCLAAPVFWPSGAVAGSINISTDATPPRIAPAAVVRSCAMATSNRLFRNLDAFLTLNLAVDLSSDLRQTSALIAFGEDGELVAMDRQARTLFAISPEEPVSFRFEELFLEDFSRIVDAGRAGRSIPLRTNQGLSLFGEVVPRIGVVKPRATLSVQGSKRVARTDKVGEGLSAMDRAVRAFEAGVPLVVSGETGVGKEVAARAVHRASVRSKSPFIALNCAAVPSELIEAELFGHAEGAFTGSRRGGAAGKFEAAHGGTLFLDEVGDMPSALQAALLRVLENGEVFRLGSHVGRRVDVRLISASHRDLAGLVKAGQFRQDLYYRLAGNTLHIPSLRSRSDFDDVLSSVLGDLAREMGLDLDRVRLSAGAQEYLRRQEWPGNVRELRHVLRYALAMAAPRQELVVDDFPLARLPVTGEAKGVQPAPSFPRSTLLLEDAERDAIQLALSSCGGNVTHAAKALGIGRATLYRKIKQFGI